MAKSGCLAPDCGSGIKARGLCANHYNQANRAVREGLTTWQKLVSKGRALASRQGQHPTADRFKRWLMG